MTKEEHIAYQKRLDAFASKVYDASLVVSDGDREFAQRAYNRARVRHYWWDAGPDGRGINVYFCWTLHRSEDGTFSTWREKHSKTEMKRDMFVHRKSKASVAEIARKRYNAFITKRGYLKKEGP